VTNISNGFTYKTAAKINWHKYGTKLRQCHRQNSNMHIFRLIFIIIIAEIKLMHVKKLFTPIISLLLSELVNGQTFNVRFVLYIEIRGLTFLTVAAAECGRTRARAGDAGSWIAVAGATRYCQTIEQSNCSTRQTNGFLTLTSAALVCSNVP